MANILTKTVKAFKNAIDGMKIESGHMYDYNTPESRVETIRWLFTYAKNKRMPQVEKWLKYNDYYEGNHVTQKEIQNMCAEKGLPFIPAVMQYPFNMVESLIIPEVPDFEFSGRDDDLDNQKAKQRQYVVQYIVEDNKLDNMNTENERQLNKLGNAFWKVAFDYSLKDGENQGKIVIGNPDPANIFPDPAALEQEDCEYLDYVYRMHKINVARRFGSDLKRLKLSINDLCVDGLFSETEIYDTSNYDTFMDTMQVIEHWFRQPYDGEDDYEYFVDGKLEKQHVSWESGDIACSIIIANTEIRYIPKYWVNTGKQNKLFPFVKYCKIPINKSYWDRSELEPILDLVDAADREIATALLNDAFNGNDIVLMEENAFSDDCEPDNTPGSHWKVKSNCIDKVRRLGGLSNLNGGLENTITFLATHIKDTVGLYDISNGGAPPANVKTLGALVELKQQGEKRQSLKRADRDAGFENLYELIDWTALEFYDDNRMIFLGAEGDTQDQMQIQANGMMSQEQQIEYAQQQQAIQEQAQQTGQQVPPQAPPNMDRKKGPIIFKFDSKNYNKDGYYPRIDAKVSVGDGIVHNKAFTLSALETISGMNINVSNYKIIMSIIDVMQLPDRKEIKEFMESYFGNLQLGMPKVTMAYKDLEPDAKVQLAQKIGIQIQKPVPEDAQGVPWSILAQNQPNVNGRVPLESQVQGQQQPQQGMTPQQQQMLNDLVNQAHVHLTPQELQHLQQHPELLQQIIQQYGGNPNGQ